MPHDMKGRKLKAGDKVNIPCIVEEVHQVEDYCNATLRTVVPMTGQTEGMQIVVNSKQCKKSEAKG